MQSFGIRILSGLFRRLRDVSFSLGRIAHCLPVPLLPTPAKPLGIQNAGASAAAAFIFLHKQIR